MDYINMVNNGYVHQNAITFKLNKLNKPFLQIQDPYILFQSSSVTAPTRVVRINGDITLPPIKLNNPDRLHFNKKNIAISGKDANHRIIPTEYQLAGTFVETNSYLLNSAIWLLPNSFQVDLKQGSYFIFNTPSAHKMKLLNRIINTNEIEIIYPENYGTYNFHSNRLLMNSLYLSLSLGLIMFVLIGVISMNREKHVIHILYITGYTIRHIYSIVLRYKVLPCIGSSVLLFVLALLAQPYLYSTWDHNWIAYALLTITGMLIFLAAQCFITVLTYTIRKGGQKY
ncbi:FtsX-like permease family protein [Paenibacillus taiwanensis]|uniref:FtsX-like permease family protein n=1 Tax=Paenibacillus taiwanensis TaxID=401638 RepID=UPI0012F9E936|nr:FtsX-like permease family protein [Paenibacillus taiwanensis]